MLVDEAEVAERPTQDLPTEERLTWSTGPPGGVDELDAARRDSGDRLDRRAVALRMSIARRRSVAEARLAGLLRGAAASALDLDRRAGHHGDLLRGGGDADGPRGGVDAIEDEAE